MFNNRFTKKDSVVDAVSQVLESWDDDEDDDVKRADAELRRMKAKPIEADKKTDPDKEIGKLAKKTPKEVDESVEQIDEVKGSALGNALRRSLTPKKISPEKIQRNRDRWAKMDAEKAEKAKSSVTEDKWTDIADGPWKKSKRNKSSAASAAANAAGKGLKGAQHKLDVAEPKGKLTGADFKKLRKEDAEQIDELDKKSLLGRIKRGDEANKKGWASFGKVITHSRAGGDQKEAQKAIRNSNRYYNLTRGGKKGKTAGGFPKSTYNEEVELDEKTLTPAESKKKEEIVKSMKKGAKGFKERYGKRAKEVMYATATKQAKKVAEEVSLYEGTGTHITLHKVGDGEFDVHHKGQSIGSVWSHRGGNRWAYHHDASGSSQAGFSKLKHAIEGLRSQHADHKVTMRNEETVSEAKGPTSTYGLDTFTQEGSTTPLSRVKELARSSMSKIKNEMLGKAGATSEEIDPSVRTTDTLKGRVAGGKTDDVGPKADGKSTKVKFTPGPK
jgi:hypothetical protein